MPRIRDSASNPLDFCRRHMPTLGQARTNYDNVEMTGPGPDGRGNCFTYNDEHPSYDSDIYTCEMCGKTLRTEDDD